jgi:hypothetical protein
VRTAHQNDVDAGDSHAAEVAEQRVFAGDGELEGHLVPGVRQQGNRRDDQQSGEAVDVLDAVESEQVTTGDLTQRDRIHRP